MRRAAKILAAFLGSVVLLVVAAVLVLSNTDWGRERVRRVVLKVLDGPVHGDVQIGRIEGNLLKGMTLRDVAIRDSAGNPFFAAEQARVGYGLGDLLHKRIALSDIRLVRPVVVLDQPPGGEWNFARIFPSDSTAPQDTTPGWGDWIVLRDVAMLGGHVVVRTPWRPDSTLAAAAQDSLTALALAGGTRVWVVRAPGGYQQVQDFRAIDARLPFVRLAHPSYETMRIESDSLRMVALPFRPPAVHLRQLRGAFELTGDSLWWQDAQVRLPASDAVVSGRYAFAGGRMAIEARARPLALADLRWLEPRLPSEGGGSMDFAMLSDSLRQRFTVRDARLETGTARLAGDLGITLAADTFAFHDTRLRFSGVRTALIEQLVPDLDVPRAGVLGGAIALDGGLRALTLDGDVTFDDARAGRNRVVATGLVGIDSGTFSARDLRLRVDPVQVALARMAVPDLPIGGTVRGTATVNGSTATGLVTHSDLVHLDRGARSHLTGDATVRLAGDATALDVDLRARPLSLVTLGRFAPAVGLRGAAVGPIRVQGTLGDLALNVALRTPDGGALTARGRFDLASRAPAYDLVVRTELFDANAVLATAPHTSLTAEASARGRGIDPATMRAAFGADVSTSVYDSVAVDSASVRATVADGLARLDTLLVRAPSARIEAGGSFGLAAGRTGALAYDVAIDSLSVLERWLPRDTGAVAPRPAVARRAVAQARADSARRAERAAVARAATGEITVAPPAGPVSDSVAAPVRRDSIAGAVYVAGVLRGGLRQFDLRGRAGARNLVFAGSTVRDLRGEYAVVGGGTRGTALAVGVQLDSASAAGFALDSVDARATYVLPVPGSARAHGSAQLLVVQADSAEYLLNGEYTLDNQRNEAVLARARFRLPSSVWASTRPGVIAWGPRGVAVDSLELRDVRNGRIFVNGLIPAEGRADLTVEIDNFQVADAIALAQSDIAAAGLASVSARLEGTAREPRLRAELGADDLAYNGGPLPDVHASLVYADRLLRARAEAARPGGQPLVTSTATVPIDLALQGVTGSRFPRQPAAIDAVLDSLPLEIIPQFTDLVANTSGRAMGAVAVRGTLPDQLTFAGQLVMDGGQGRIVPLGITLTQLAGSVRLQGDTIVVDSLAGRSGGSIRLVGGVGVAKLTAPSFDLRLRAQDAQVLNSDRGQARVDADLSLYGPFARAYASGGVRVRQGVIYLQEGGGTNPIELDPNDPTVFSVVDTSLARQDQLLISESPLLRNLRANIHLRVDRDTWVRSSAANVEVYSDGDLVIDVDQRRGAFTLDGVMSTERGEYTFLSKRFQVQRGSATFTGVPELNPLLQATAAYDLPLTGREALNIGLLIGGTLDRPSLTLTSDAQPPISQSDLLSYLAFGRSSSSLLSFSGGSGLAGGGSSGSLVGATAALAANQLTGAALGVFVNALEANAARSLGADVLNITPADVPTELWKTNLSGFVRSTEVEYGKYLTTQSFLALTARPQVLVNPNEAPPGIRYQYRLPRGLRVETSFETRYLLREPTLSVQVPQSNNVFGAFLIREWRF